MIVDIWIGGKKWDLYSETNIKHTIQANDIAEVKDRQASFTNSFTSPKTPNNIQIANGLGISSDTSRIPYEKPSCQMKVEGFDMIVKGWINITETDDEYKIYVYSGIINFFKAIENKTLGNLVLTEIVHTKNLSTVVDSFSNPNYKYLITDYNGLTHYGDNDEIINIDHLIPSVNVKYLWDKIHSTFSFPYFGETFETAEFINLWLTYPKSIAIDETEILVQGSDNRFVSVYGNANSYYRGIFIEALEAYRTFTALETAKYRIKLNVTNSFLIQYGFPSVVKYFLSINQENLPWQDRTDSLLMKEVSSSLAEPFTIEQFIDLNESDVISFYDFFEMNGIFTWSTDFDLTIEKMNTGEPNFNKELKDFQISDFVKEVLNQFSLTIFTDEFSNDLKYLSLKERTELPAIDFSDKYILRKSENYVYEYYARRNTFAYQYNDKESTHKNWNINILNQNIADRKTVFVSKTYAPENTLSSFYLGSIGIDFLEVFKLYDKSVEEKEDVTVIKYKGLEKRFHFVRAENIISNAIFGSKTYNETANVSSFYLATFKNLDWKTLLQKNYSEFKGIINDSRIQQIELDLNIVDLLQLNISGLYYFSQEQQYYFLNKLNFDNNKANGEFIRYKKFEPQTIIPEDPETFVKIVWVSDETNAPKSGFDSTIDIQIAETSNADDDLLVSFVWEKHNGISWINLGTGVTPYTAALVEGVQKFRIKATSQNSNVFYSNELEYTKIVIYECHQYYITSFANSGDDLSVFWTDCNGIQQESVQYGFGSGVWLTLTICAREGAYNHNGNGEDTDQGLC